MGRPTGFKMAGDPTSASPAGVRGRKVAPPTYEGMSEETGAVAGSHFSAQPQAPGISCDGGHIDCQTSSASLQPDGAHVTHDGDVFQDNHVIAGGTLEGSSVTTVPLGGRGLPTRRQRRGG